MGVTQYRNASPSLPPCVSVCRFVCWWPLSASPLQSLLSVAITWEVGPTPHLTSCICVCVCICVCGSQGPNQPVCRVLLLAMMMHRGAWCASMSTTRTREVHTSRSYSANAVRTCSRCVNCVEVLIIAVHPCVCVCVSGGGVCRSHLLCPCEPTD